MFVDERVQPSEDGLRPCFSDLLLSLGSTLEQSTLCLTSCKEDTASLTNDIHLCILMHKTSDPDSSLRIDL